MLDTRQRLHARLKIFWKRGDNCARSPKLFGNKATIASPGPNFFLKQGAWAAHLSHLLKYLTSLIEPQPLVCFSLSLTSLFSRSYLLLRPYLSLTHTRLPFLSLAGRTTMKQPRGGSSRCTARAPASSSSSTTPLVRDHPHGFVLGELLPGHGTAPSASSFLSTARRRERRRHRRILSLARASTGAPPPSSGLAVAP
jgi:hypothetical protein